MVRVFMLIENELAYVLKFGIASLCRCTMTCPFVGKLRSG